MEEIVAYLTNMNMFWIYVSVFTIAYIENIFPPFPSDVIVVFAGSMVAIGEGDIILTLLFATSGSTLGFMSMYWLGAQFGHRVLEAERIPFITMEIVEKVQAWFARFGYWVVIANRFLAGTRAVISFCTGIAGMNLLYTSILSALSALLWNSILVFTGAAVGENWRDIGEYLSTYSLIVSFVIAIAILVWIIVAFFRLRKQERQNDKSADDA